MLNGLSVKAIESKRLLENVQDKAQYLQDQADINTEQIKTETRSALRASKSDKRRLLRACAGLRDDAHKSQSQLSVVRREQRQLASDVSRNAHIQSMETRNGIHTLDQYASQARLAATGLLARFTSSSMDVIKHLKKLHLSNMEIHMLLLRLQNTVTLPPTSFLGDSITFVDALDRTYILPYAYPSNWEVFEALLRCKFKDVPGHEEVVRGNTTSRTCVCLSAFLHKLTGNISCFRAVALICRWSCSCPWQMPVAVQDQGASVTGWSNAVHLSCNGKLNFI